MNIQKTSFYPANAPKQTQRIQTQPKTAIKFGMDTVVYIPSRATSEYITQTVEQSAAKLLTKKNQEFLVKYVNQAVTMAIEEGTLNARNHQNVRAFVNRTIQEALTDNEAAVSKSLANIIENTVAKLFENNKKRVNRIFQQNFNSLMQMGIGTGMAATGYYVLPSIASNTLSNTVVGTGLATAALGAYNLKLTPSAEADKNNEPPLCKAIENGDITAAESYIEAGNHLDTVNKDNQTPLLLALQKKNYYIAEKLLKAGADPKIGFLNDNGDYITPLSLAQDYGANALARKIKKLTRTQP
jgi:hypothetical protein